MRSYGGGADRMGKLGACASGAGAVCATTTGTAEHGRVKDGINTNCRMRTASVDVDGLGATGDDIREPGSHLAPGVSMLPSFVAERE